MASIARLHIAAVALALLGASATASAEPPQKVTVKKGGAVEVDSGTGSVRVNPDGSVEVGNTKSKTKVVTTGGTSKVTAEAPEGTDADFIVQGSAKKVTHDCGNGGNADIQGSANQVTLKGTCTKVTVQGSGNSVHIQTAAKIDVQGTGNKVIWVSGAKGRAPKISHQGVDNAVTQQKP